jgi:hypothetical protein
MCYREPMQKAEKLKNLAADARYEVSDQNVEFLVRRDNNQCLTFFGHEQ